MEILRNEPEKELRMQCLPGRQIRLSFLASHK
jgi:hypothetical protein